MQSTHENMAAELSGLLAKRDENHQQINELQQDAATITQQKQGAEAELDRWYGTHAIFTIAQLFFAYGLFIFSEI